MHIISYSALSIVCNFHLCCREMTDLESQVASVEGSLKMVNENYVGLRLEALLYKVHRKDCYINNYEILFHRKNLQKSAQEGLLNYINK